MSCVFSFSSFFFNNVVPIGNANVLAEAYLKKWRYVLLNSDVWKPIIFAENIGDVVSIEDAFNLQEYKKRNASNISEEDGKRKTSYTGNIQVLV